MNLFIFACQGCPGWQQVDAEQEEVEEEAREQTEAEREILEALKQLGKARATTIANAMGANRGNTSSVLASCGSKERFVWS